MFPATLQVSREKTASGLPLLVYRHSEGTKAYVIAMHQGGGYKEAILVYPYIRELALNHYGIVAFDLLEHGERGLRGWVRPLDQFQDVRLWMQIYSQFLKDLDEVVGYVRNERGYQGKMGFVGGSRGGDCAYLAAAHCREIDVVAAYLGNPSFEHYRRTVEKDASVDALARDLDPSLHLGTIFPKALLMLTSEYDDFAPASRVRQVYHKLKPLYRRRPSRLKMVMFRDSEHVYRYEMGDQMVAWFKRFLK